MHLSNHQTIKLLHQTIKQLHSYTAHSYSATRRKTHRYLQIPQKNLIQTGQRGRIIGLDLHAVAASRLIRNIFVTISINTFLAQMNDKAYESRGD